MNGTRDETMPALYKSGPGAGLELVEAPVPRPGADEVLIRVLLTGICGTDLHILQWDDWAQGSVRTPLIPGHECVGRIVETGSGVRGLREGQTVGVEGHLTCGRCAQCRSGARHLCLNNINLGVHTDGVFARYVVVPAANVWVHGEGVPLEVASIFDPLGNAVHAATTHPVSGLSVLITGAGPIGLMAAQICARMGARSVVVTDVSSFRLLLAENIDVVPAAAPESGSEELREAGDTPLGFDIGLEMSGAPEALQTMLDAVSPGGRIVALGLPSRETSVDWADISTRMLSIQGVSGRRIPETWRSVAALVANGLDPSFVITHTFRYDQYAEAFATAASGRAGKVLLDWT
ncbi:L-threonine 3-dehydrogenase [Nocardiopsis sp. B62]|uniref:L-threonine 3-dehydrogenase n=1 Tax=Nocardiopsis sp. B62 TaxID=2824874 RepID=UPI001FFC69E0|nr:L-threonine 3-dehydrogenase [Nocardiopsis sp. B62]